jgi:hypothetical protein
VTSNAKSKDTTHIKTPTPKDQRNSELLKKGKEKVHVLTSNINVPSRA